MRLTALNRAAIACGLATGSSLADARAIAPNLVVHNHDTQSDADFLDRIADGCMRYTPMVSTVSPDAIILDITGSAHLAGSENALARNVQNWFDDKRIEVCLALASSAEAAHALARFHSGPVTDERAAIRALPIAVLELDPEAELGLLRAGLKTIGAVMERPRNVIAARFGTACVYHLERLIGASAKPINSRVAPPSRSVHRRFAEPLTSKDYALTVLRELLDEANTALAQDDLGGRAFEVRFCRVDGLVQRVLVETGLPTRDSLAIAKLFDERLDSLADPLDPGFGFDSVALAVLRTEPLRPEQDDIEQDTPSDNALAQTLDMLAIRLGRNRLLRFRPNDTHIPEDGQCAVPVMQAPQTFTWSRPPTGEPPARPLQLFDPPQRIAVIAEIPDGPPRRFRWRRTARDIVHYEGPERIAAEWWKHANDPLGYGQLTRDYYRVEDSDGRRYWVFRHGLYDRETVDPNWYVHGVFA